MIDGNEDCVPVVSFRLPPAYATNNSTLRERPVLISATITRKGTNCVPSPFPALGFPPTVHHHPPPAPPPTTTHHSSSFRAPATRAPGRLLIPRHWKIQARCDLCCELAVSTEDVGGVFQASLRRNDSEKRAFRFKAEASNPPAGFETDQKALVGKKRREAGRTKFSRGEEAAGTELLPASLAEGGAGGTFRCGQYARWATIASPAAAVCRFITSCVVRHNTEAVGAAVSRWIRLRRWSTLKRALLSD